MQPERRDVRQIIFKYRSYTPIPFFILMVVFARPTLTSLITGLCTVAAGEFIRFWGVSIAGSETRTTGTVGGTYLITNGPFSYVRNPLYLGNMLMYAGIGVMSMALFPWFFGVALAWFYLQYYFIVTREEEYLAERFGSAYDHYRDNVRRFLPRLTPYRSGQPPAKTVNLREGFASENRTLQAIALVTLLLVGIYFIRGPGG
jgi:protein-S-isoprenylcysteine O-methyltransferase Ste14